MSIKKTLLATSLFAFSTYLLAIPITGTIGFIGAIKKTPTAITFNNVITSPFALSNTGTYDGLNAIKVSMNKITINPFYSVANPLWSFSKNGKSYSFELATLNTNPNFTFMSGTGILKATGFDDTAGIWEFSTQVGMTFSAGSAAIPPTVTTSEPGSIALLGLGLAGVGLSRRKKLQTA